MQAIEKKYCGAYKIGEFYEGAVKTNKKPIPLKMRRAQRSAFKTSPVTSVSAARRGRWRQAGSQGVFRPSDRSSW